MLPFARMSTYGNSTLDPLGLKKMGATSGSLFYLNNSGQLYMTGLNTNGEAGTGTVQGTFFNVPKLLRSSVKDFWSTGSSGAIIYVDINDKFWFTGSEVCFSTVLNNVSNPKEITSYFTAINVHYDQIKEIDFHYNSKVNLLLKDGSLYCAGKNNVSTVNSSFGDGTNTDSPNAFRLIRGNVLKVSGNYIQDNNGILLGCGNSASYQLGSTTSSTTFVTIPNVTGVVQDFSSSYTGVYVLISGSIYIQGKSLGNFGEFGDGSTAVATYQTLTRIVQSGTNIVQLNVNIGNLRTMNVTSTGSLTSSGYNNVGQMGTGNTNTISTFTNTPIPAVISQIVLPAVNTYIINNTQGRYTLYSCGNDIGGLGGTTGSAISTFRQVPLVGLRT